MKSIRTLLAPALFTLAVAPVFAGGWDGNADMEQSILNDLSEGPGGFVATGLPADKPAGAFDGNVDMEQSILNDLTREGYGGFVATSLPADKPAGLFDGNSDMEQSILNDL